MNNSKAKKCLSILLSVIMAFGVFATGALSLTALAEDQYAVVHITPGEGVESLIVKDFNSGAAIADGDSVAYGTHITVHAVAHTAYETLPGGVIPVYINDVYTSSLLSVDTPEVTITTAALSKKVYQLRFNASGGELEGTETTRPVSWNEPLPEAIRVKERPGYTFKGYTIIGQLAYDENYTPLILHPLPGGGGTAFAEWELNTYDITINPNGGELDGFEVQYGFDGSGTVYPDTVTDPYTVTYTVNNTKSVPYVMPPAGYSFTGWAVTGEDHGWPETADQNVSVNGKWGDVTLTARFEPKTNTRYYVRYYVMNDDGTYPTSPTSSVTRYGTTDTLATAETDPPEGFSVDTERSTLTGNINGMGNRILKVYYKFNTYSVVFKDADGNVLQESALRSGATPTAPEELPEKAYDDSFHYIAGWDRAIAPVTDDAVYTLVYTPEAHDYTNYTQIAPATCTANAREQGACACGKTDVREIEGSTDPNAHSYVNYVYNGDATFTEDGTETALCEYDAAHSAFTRPAQNTAFRNRYSGDAADVIAAAEDILNDAQENPESYEPAYIEALSDALDEILNTDVNYLTDEQAAAIEQTLTDLVNEADGNMIYDRTVQFRNIARMHYVIEEGDGYAIYNSSTVKWFSTKELKFHVYIYSNFPYETYQVYINGVEATPDENGVYTIPAGSHADTVSIAGATEHYERVACSYCGEMHDGTLWGRLIALIHQILAFFIRVFG